MIYVACNCYLLDFVYTTHTFSRHQNVPIKNTLVENKDSRVFMLSLCLI